LGARLKAYVGPIWHAWYRLNLYKKQGYEIIFESLVTFFEESSILRPAGGSDNNRLIDTMNQACPGLNLITLLGAYLGAYLGA